MQDAFDGVDHGNLLTRTLAFAHGYCIVLRTIRHRRMTLITVQVFSDILMTGGAELTRRIDRHRLALGVVLQAPSSSSITTVDTPAATKDFMV